jgi:hypothetical protein
LFSLPIINSVYLAAVSLLEQISGEIQHTDFYLLMFLLHSGLLVSAPVILFMLARMNRFCHKPPDRHDAHRVMYS